MRVIQLNCDGWRTRDDFYDAFFAAVGAPSWHGRNFNALRDSISTGSINRVEVPYEILLLHKESATGGALQIANQFIDFIHELSNQGCNVAIRVER